MSAALQAWPDVGLILGVVVINVGIGLFQEGKAEKVMQYTCKASAATYWTETSFFLLPDPLLYALCGLSFPAV